MPARKPISLRKQTRNVFVLLLIAVLFLTSSAFVNPQGQTPDPYAKPLAVKNARSSVPEAAAPALPVSAVNRVHDPSFEGYWSSSDWAQYSTNVVTPLCITADCGDGGGTAGPRSGSAWAWFGGINFSWPGAVSPEYGELTQYVNFPSCGATLQFYLWIGAATPGSGVDDYVAASIDGHTVFSANATQKGSYPAYRLVSVNLNAYADGGSHTLKFTSVTSGQLVTFNLDDVSITANCIIISGNTGAAGAKLTYPGGVAFADGAGNYELHVAPGFSGTVTPSHADYIFLPASRSYNSLTADQISQHYEAVPLHTISGNVGIGGATVTYSYINSQTVTSLPNGNYSFRVPATWGENWGGTVTPTHPCFTFTPADRTYFSVPSNMPGENFTPAAVPAASCSDIDVEIGGANQGKFALEPGASTRASFSGVNNGPVKIVNTDSTSLIAAERLIYKFNNVNTSFIEMMGLPDNQVDNTYWLPWYNNFDLDTQLRFANVSASPATVTITIGGQPMGSPIPLAAGASTRVSFAGVNAGPVKIVSTQNIVAAERLIYKVGGKSTSFTEMMALPNKSLDTTYWLPWYNNADLDTQLRFANVSASPASVHVYIGGVEMTGSPFPLLAGESTRKSFPGINNGPVKIVSDQNIVAAERLIYKVNNVATSFTEMMALPNSALNTTYWLPWYNNKDLDTQLRFANVHDTQTATVHVYIGGAEMTGSPFTLLPGESTRKSFPNVNDGPVQIVSNVPIVAAERLIYKVNNIATSFSEMMALPDTQLDTIYWLPWYNNADLDTQLRFGVP